MQMLNNQMTVTEKKNNLRIFLNLKKKKSYKMIFKQNIQKHLKK